VDAQHQCLEGLRGDPAAGVAEIFASPWESPSIPSGSILESMQVTIATPAWATPSNPPSSKVSAKERLAASRSSKPVVSSATVRR